MELSTNLLDWKIFTVGAQHSYRDKPAKVRNPRYIAKHDIIAQDNEKVVVLAWKKKEIVKAISRKHDDTWLTIQRRKKGGYCETENVEKPACICKCNKYMSEVDCVDQMIWYCLCT